MKKTKIVCTIGPASSDVETLKKMIKAGMNVARFNMSHGNHESHAALIEAVKTARNEMNACVALMIDLKGPEVRIRQFENGKVMLKKGGQFILTTKNVLGTHEYVSVNYAKFPRIVQKGARVLLNDGLIELKVLDTNTDSVLTQVVVGGELSNNKSINLPDSKLDMEFLSEVDKRDIDFAKLVDADLISLSFVSEAQDVLDARKYLKKIGFEGVKIIAKIENKLGVKNLEEIVKVSDGVMVARGDMGVEVEYEKIPAIQKKIIKLCRMYGKVSITATQMLESMISSPRPTRAEISDVANACVDGSTCVMLSGETSAGEYPVESICAMTKIIEECEKTLEQPRDICFSGKDNTCASIGFAACNLAESLDAGSILVVTRSGGSACNISRFRPKATILACTPSKKAYYQMAYLWGVVPIMDREFVSLDELIGSSKQKAIDTKLVKRGELFVEVAGIKTGDSGIDLIRVDRY